MKRDRASELRAIADGRLMLNVRNGVTVSRSMLAMIADEFEAMSTALAEALKALEPFAEIAGEPWADENGWTNAACQNDRICDWFGPSAFRTARRALKALEARDG